MNHTKEQILDIAKNVLRELRHLEDKTIIEDASFDPNDQIPFMEGVRSAWTVYLVEPFFDQSQFLFIDDNTGEPIYLQVKYGGHKILRMRMANINMKSNGIQASSQSWLIRHFTCITQTSAGTDQNDASFPAV